MAIAVAIVTLVALAGFVFYLIYTYGNIRKMNKWTLLFSFLGWYFPFSIVFIMPIDVISAQYNDCIIYHNSTEYLNATIEAGAPWYPDPEANCPMPIAYAPSDFLAYFWMAAYWTMFMQCWAIAPLLQSYSLSGGFTFLQKLWDSFKENIILYAAMGVLGAIGLIYIAVSQGLDMESLLGLVMAMANAYGLFLLLPFMGYGLVNIPRSLWYKANRTMTLKYQQFKAPMYRDDLDEANTTLREVMRDVNAANNQVPHGHKLRPFVDTILTKCGDEIDNRERERHSSSDEEINLKTLRKLHYRVMAAIQARNRCRTQWQRLVIRAFHLQDVEKNVDNSSHYFMRSWKQSNDNDSFARFKATFAWYYYVQIEPWFYRILSIGAMLLSIFIVWSECTFSVQNPRLSVFYYMLNFEGVDSLGITIITLGTLSYMCLCAYSSLLRLRIFNYFYIVNGHETDENSLLFCSAMLGRLTFPLCYNFLFLLQHHTTTYFTVMGEIDFLPLLGLGFNIYMPIVLGIIVVLVLLNVTERLLNWFEIKVFRYDQAFEDDSIQEGREMLDKVRERTEQNPITHPSELDYERGGNINTRMLGRPSSRGPATSGGKNATTSRSSRSVNNHNDDEYHDDEPLPPPATHPSSKKTTSRFGGWFSGVGGSKVDTSDPNADTVPLTSRVDEYSDDRITTSSSRNSNNAFVRGSDVRKQQQQQQRVQTDAVEAKLAAMDLDSINLFSKPSTRPSSTAPPHQASSNSYASAAAATTTSTASSYGPSASLAAPVPSSSSAPSSSSSAPSSSNTSRKKPPRDMFADL